MHRVSRVEACLPFLSAFDDEAEFTQVIGEGVHGDVESSAWVRKVQHISCGVGLFVFSEGGVHVEQRKELVMVWMYWRRCTQ